MQFLVLIKFTHFPYFADIAATSLSTLSHCDRAAISQQRQCGLLLGFHLVYSLVNIRVHCKNAHNGRALVGGEGVVRDGGVQNICRFFCWFIVTIYAHKHYRPQSGRTGSRGMNKYASHTRSPSINTIVESTITLTTGAGSNPRAKYHRALGIL